MFTTSHQRNDSSVGNTYSAPFNRVFCAIVFLQIPPQIRCTVGGMGRSGERISMNSVLMSAFAAFGGILYGYDSNVIVGVLANTEYLITFGHWDPTRGYYLPITDNTLIVSILTAGAVFGSLLAPPLGDHLGRKYGIVAGCLVFCLGVGLQLDTSWVVFVIGRFIAGIGFSIVSGLVPIYQSECAPKAIRGMIIGLYQVSISIGTLVAAIVLNSTSSWASHSAWRTPIAIQFAWATILGGGMLFLPESPRFFLLKGNEKAARQALSRLLNKPVGSQEVDDECRAMGLKLEQETSGSTYLDCFVNNQSRHGLRTWTCIFLPAWQQLTGFSFIFYYAPTFFRNAGMESAYFIVIIFDVLITVTTICSLPLIDRIGRRRLLIIGAAGMCICEFVVAIVSLTAGKIQISASGVTLNLVAQRVLVAFVCIYIAFFSVSWAPIPVVIAAEVFPLSIRAKGLSLFGAVNWLWNFGVPYATPYLVDPSTSGVKGMKGAGLETRVFFIWGATCVGSLLFAYFCVPETRGLSLEQIEVLYRESSMTGSVKYRQIILDRAARKEEDEKGELAGEVHPMDVLHFDDADDGTTAVLRVSASPSPPP